MNSMVSAVTKWKGTPYRHLGRGIGGLDCIGLIVVVLRELGYLGILEDFYYSRDWYVHSKEELLVETIKKHAGINSHKISITEFNAFPKIFLPGDILLFKIHSPQCPVHHCAIAISQLDFIHSLQDVGVVKQKITLEWAKWLHSSVRLEK